MITKIGIIAGTIWEILDKKEEVELSRLCDELRESEEVILMSLGWLVREGHVTLADNQDTYKVHLRD